MNRTPTLPSLIALAAVACFITTVGSQRVAAQATSFTVSGTVTNASGQGIADVTMILVSDVAGTQIAFTNQSGNYVFNHAGGVSHSLRIIPSKSGWVFNPLMTIFVSTSALNFDISQSFVGTQLPIVLPVNMPVLLTQPNSQRALALDSVMQTSDPFGVGNDYNFSTDHRSRISLFAVNVALNPGENPASAIEAQAETPAGQIFPLTVEHFGTVPNFTWLKQVIVKLPVEIANSNEVRVSLRVQGIDGNKVIVKVKP
ncbi:MAG TPA: carboxypeptidase-like regulatory domain-containing protein [Pyrinomonadaceae bacterium]